MQKNEKGRAVRCSFCGKVQDDVERIIEFNKNLLADNNKKILSYCADSMYNKKKIF